MTDDKPTPSRNTLADTMRGELSSAETEKELAEEEARLARSAARAALPAIWVDTWAVLTWSGHMRIVLGESMPTGTVYRGAYVMTIEDAERFANYILRDIADEREELAKEKQPRDEKI